MLRILNRSKFQKVFLITTASAFLMACAGERQLASGEPAEPSFQDRLAECSMIGDRSERNRCLYGN